MTNKGFIRVFRSILDWEWYTDPNTKCVFLHCLLKANWSDKAWRGIEIERGQFLTSLDSLARETGLSVRNIRTALAHLKSTGELTSEATQRYTMVTICNYEKYANKDDFTDIQTDTQPDIVPTNDRQTTDKQPTTTKTNKTNKTNKNNKCVLHTPAHSETVASMIEYFRDHLIETTGIDQSLNSQWMRYAQNDANMMRRQGYSNDRVKAALDWLKENEFFADITSFKKLTQHILEIEHRMAGAHPHSLEQLIPIGD